MKRCVKRRDAQTKCSYACTFKLSEESNEEINQRIKREREISHECLYTKVQRENTVLISTFKRPDPTLHAEHVLFNANKTNLPW